MDIHLWCLVSPLSSLLCIFQISFDSYFGHRDNEVEALSETHDLCVGGDCVEMLQQSSAVHKVIPYVKVVIDTFVKHISMLHGLLF